jgi:hypothetical protein
VRGVKRCKSGRRDGFVSGVAAKQIWSTPYPSKWSSSTKRKSKEEERGENAASRKQVWMKTQLTLPSRAAADARLLPVPS